MAITCPKCQYDNTDTARFCSNCATVLTKPGQRPPFLTKTLESPAYVLSKGSVVAGKYRILDEIGRGGMGVVYRGHDESLDRDVAIKVLPAEFAADPDRLRRFEQEARSVAALNHPNILAIHEVGRHEGAPYFVTELLQGESLRERLSGAAMPVRKALETAVQIAEGLAAAHEKHVIHRDLKPENAFLTKDGHVKILDFGLAKLAAPRTGDEVGGATLTEATQAGTVLGTVGYMSPEQVLGKPLDGRSDLFSFGIVLYEMLAGRRPFHKGSAPETMTAILKEEPPELGILGVSVPPGLERIVRHCLEKEPSRRFQSAQDVSFALESLSQVTTAGVAPLRAAARKSRLALGGFITILLAACVVGFFIWGKHAARPPLLSFKRITLQRGTVISARFAPDFQSVVYSARWEGKPAELFVQRLASADARSLGVIAPYIEITGTAGADVAVAVAGPRFPRWPLVESTVQQLPLEGGTPRDLFKDVDSADWDRSGAQYAIVRTVKDRQHLEYPVGKVLFETTGVERIQSPRISPDGARIAFVFLPTLTDASGDVCVVDMAGRMQTLSKGWLEIGQFADMGAFVGLGWSRDGNEIWFSATQTGFRRELHAVTLSGKERLVARLPGSIVIQDVAPDGRVLATFGQSRRLEMRGRMAGDAAERDLSCLDGTYIPVLAPDGTQMLFQEWGEGGTAQASAYHWRMDGSRPKRLGFGSPFGVSPDWTTALVMVGNGANYEARLVPIGAGETRTLPRGPIHTYAWALWHPDGKRIVSIGSDAEGQVRLFVQDVAGGEPHPFARLEDYPAWLAFSPDGRFIAARAKRDGPYVLCPIDGGETRPIPFLKAYDWPLVFSNDGGSLFVSENLVGEPPVHVMRLDLKTGKREPWLELAPPDRAGVLSIQGEWLTPNGRFYTYVYARSLSDLYLVEGLK